MPNNPMDDNGRLGSQVPNRHAGEATMTLEHGTILLVDDEPFILQNTARLLRGAGHTVHTCEQWTGVAAVIHSEQPDIILMDFNMPSIKGDELCRILRRTMVGDHTPIFIFSSEPESDLVDIVARSGADGYIRKNAAGHVLLSAVSTALEGLRAERVTVA